MLSDYHLISFALVLALVGLKRWRRTRLPFPPGPSGYPIIGNLFDMPSELQWAKYLEWSKRYNSDAIYLDVIGSPIIVLNSYKAANDLLSVRSLLYSDRPVGTMLTELLGIVSEPHAVWSCMAHSPSRVLVRIQPRTFAESPPETALVLTRSSSTAPERTEEVSPSYRITLSPNIERAEKALVQLKEAAITGNFLVDVLPFLKYIPSWFPEARFKAYAERVRPDTVDMREAPYRQGFTLLREGKGQPSVLSGSLQRGGYSIDNPPDEEVIKDVTWIAYAGGAETSQLVLSTFFAAMLLYPEAQKKCQEELDAYLGSRLPVFEDLPHSPYVRAIMLEAIRQVNSLLSLSFTPYARHPGVAHRLTMDDEYKGYFIPKGSTVFVNTWALLRDEEYYPDPDMFDPERFLKEGELNPKSLDPIPNFGFGRRICPGRFFAMDSLLMSIASTLFCFDITKAKDSEGRDVEPDIRWDPGFTRHIVPFKCCITPRSAEATKLIRDSEFA
ncbi:hypothetical protein CCMSSC00406_0007957 [Pleurotus cornucopiae]|uniref:Uncharacterized protein n=1 Tax=Pleurotus cornucopiae TaxID=5321 RepID=A0ACB7IJN7_PLECO|nr:hypothetical protein CCMSSC00406_0007957 [Pleurotus cornucopiae]